MKAKSLARNLRRLLLLILRSLREASIVNELLPRCLDDTSAQYKTLSIQNSGNYYTRRKVCCRYNAVDLYGRFSA
jgi:hypothetical protein